jgi:hypothetical protein
MHYVQLQYIVQMNELYGKAASNAVGDLMYDEFYE